MPVYVYGIVPGDVETKFDASGVGEPPGKVRLVDAKNLGAVVSDVDPSRPLGRPEDLKTHAGLLDAIAGEVPVLPLRFGAVLSDDEAVASELLGEHADEFTDALRQLEGDVQYVIKGRYLQDAIIGEILSEDSQAARLSRQIRGADPDATRDARIALGEVINNVVSAKRERDTRVLGEALEGVVVATAVRDPTHELDAVHVAVLADPDEEPDLERAVARLARDWDGRAELRLIGPMAAYDFVGTARPGG